MGDGRTVSQLKRMFAGGNKNATEFFSKHGINVNSLNSRTKSIENKYCSKAARLYKTFLDQKIKTTELDEDIKEIIYKFVKEKKQQDKKNKKKNNYSSSSDEDEDDTERDRDTNAQKCIAHIGKEKGGNC